MQSVANFRPETSMFSPESTQLASNANNLGQVASQVPPTPPQITPDTYGRLGTLNTPPTPAAPSLNTSGIQQFVNPSGTGPGFTTEMPANVPGATQPVTPQIGLKKINFKRLPSDIRLLQKWVFLISKGLILLLQLTMGR